VLMEHPQISAEPARLDDPLVQSRPRALYQSRGGPTLQTLSMADLQKAQAEPPPMLGIIPKVGLTVLAGAPKVGKSLLASQMALTLTCCSWRGVDGSSAPQFLGRDINAGPAGARALLVMEEGSIAGITYRLLHQLGGIGVFEPQIDIALRQRIRLESKASRLALTSWARSWEPQLIVLDPLNRLHGADENRPTQMTPVMDAMSNLAYDYGCAVLAIHHLAKPSADRRGDIWDRFRGASTIRSATDANLAMEGMGGRVELVGEYRDAEPLAISVELNRDTLTFGLSDDPKLPTTVDRRALDAFLHGRDQVTVRQLALALGVSKNTAQSILETLGLDHYDGTRNTRHYIVGDRS
jgi:AAA domain-containing protein